MTLAGWIAYNLFACSTIALVGYLTGRAAIRRNKAISDAIAKRTEEQIARNAELARAEQAEWERHRAETAAFLAELDEENDEGIELAVQLRKHPEADAEKLPGLAALVIRSLDQFERDLGGDGFEYDEEATTEDATHLTLHLTFNDPDGAEERKEEIQRALAELVADTRRSLASSRDADIRAKIASELELPIPRELAAYLKPVAA